MAADLSAKRLELLKLLVPSINGVAVLWDLSNPGMALRVRETRQAAEQLKIAFLTPARAISMDCRRVSLPFPSNDLKLWL